MSPAATAAVLALLAVAAHADNATARRRYPEFGPHHRRFWGREPSNYTCPLKSVLAPALQSLRDDEAAATRFAGAVPLTERDGGFRLVCSCAYYSSPATLELHARLLLKYARPTTVVVAHLSLSTAFGDAYAEIHRLGPAAAARRRVLLNPARIPTERGRGSVIVSHLLNFWCARHRVPDMSHFALVAENSFVFRPGFEAFVAATGAVDIERDFRVSDRADKVKPCAAEDAFWRRVVFDDGDPHHRGAKGMCECSYYPAGLWEAYLCSVGPEGVSRLLSPEMTNCMPEEHWHPTWMLRHVDWRAWRDATAATMAELRKPAPPGDDDWRRAVVSRIPPVDGADTYARRPFVTGSTVLAENADGLNCTRACPAGDNFRACCLRALSDLESPASTPLRAKFCWKDSFFRATDDDAGLRALAGAADRADLDAPRVFLDGEDAAAVAPEAPAAAPEAPVAPAPEVPAASLADLDAEIRETEAKLARLKAARARQSARQPRRLKRHA